MDDRPEVHGHRRLGLAGIAILSMAMFGTSFWGIVLALRGIPPVTMAFLRPLIASISLICFFFIIGKCRVLGGFRGLFTAGIGGRMPILPILGTAMFGSVLPNILQNIGMLMMDPGSTSTLASLIQGGGPVFTILLASVVLKERIGVFKVAGLFIVVPATFFLSAYSSEGFSLTSKETVGGLLNLLTAVSYSVSAMFLKIALNRGARPERLIIMNGLLAGLMTAPVLAVFCIAGWEDPASILNASAESLLALFYVSFGIYAVSGLLWYRAYRSDEVSRITFYVFLLPLFSAVWGYAMLGERLSPPQLAAGILVLVGVGIAQVRTRVRTRVNPIYPR
ncbi:MAG: DMT family transporter [Candidatus Thermoplasmatota archaeon]|nr:DMT family transporter [Candidatus Thermoplasmatota archaeon]